MQGGIKLSLLIGPVRVPAPVADHPYLNGAWALVFEEWDWDDREVIGVIPRHPKS